MDVMKSSVTRKKEKKSPHRCYEELDEKNGGCSQWKGTARSKIFRFVLANINFGKTDETTVRDLFIVIHMWIS